MIQSNFFVRYFTIGKNSHSLGSRPNKMIKILLFVDRTENQPFYPGVFVSLLNVHAFVKITSVIKYH